MAFDLIGPTRRTSIDHQDELLFDIAALAGVRGPAMKRLWEQFYDGPSFTPEEANLLAQEFMTLLAAIRSNPELAEQTWEMRTKAYRRNYGRPGAEGLEAKCVELIAVCQDGATGSEGLHSLSD